MSRNTATPPDSPEDDIPPIEHLGTTEKVLATYPLSMRRLRHWQEQGWITTYKLGQTNLHDMREIHALIRRRPELQKAPTPKTPTDAAAQVIRRAP